MHYTTIAVSLFAAAAAAQNSTSLPDLVSQLPQCATGCLDSSAEKANCASTDFDCLCGTGRDEFISAITGCILTAGCSSDDLTKASSLAPQICTEVADDPSPSEVAAASSIVASALSTASPTPTGAAPARPELGYGVLGAAALAAFAL
ncbi:hypothetical protein F4778DRAFT_678127 [Xylariomycetidae sp. FL2044]|nr:hypothetical protein F4778DRAFT_678127 [Xylariomycetidae sp. FL2044]